MFLLSVRGLNLRTQNFQALVTLDQGGVFFHRHVFQWFVLISGVYKTLKDLTSQWLTTV